MNDAYVLIFTLIVAGHLCARTGLFPDNASETLNRYVIYVALPALVLSLLPTLRLESSLLMPVLAPYLMLVLGVLLVLLFARVHPISREQLAVLLLCVPMGNTSFLGFPMIAALLGEHAVRYAVLFDQLGSFLILATYGLLVIARFSGGVTPTPKIVLLRVLKFPPFIALLVGLLLPFSPVTLPAGMDPMLRRLGDSLVPVAMFAVGLKLQLRVPRPALPFAFGLTVKLIVLPLLTWAVLRAAGGQGLPLHATVLEAGMPAMMSAGALAIMAGLAPELAAALVGYGIVASMVTLPLLSSLL